MAIFHARLRPNIALVCCLLFGATPAIAIGGEEDLRVALHNLVAAGDDLQQPAAREAWQTVVDGAGPADLTLILSAMKNPDALVLNLQAPEEVGPLATNWLRAAADAVAERELEKSGKLPTQDLEAFVMEVERSPRARRVAYEWLTKVDAEAPSRLLPRMLDDESLELRYDAIAALIDEAKAADDDAMKVEKYQRAFKSARDKSQFKACAEALKELGETPKMAEQMGFLVSWHVIGPFDNSDRAGFAKVFPPEEAVDLSAEIDGRDGNVQWKEVVAEQEDFDRLGTVDFNKELVEEKSVLAYATTTFVSDKEQAVECRWESKEATKLWINGQEVAVKNVYHSGGGFDQYRVACQFNAGANEILIKVCQNEQTQPWTKPWDFRLRVTDRLGGAIQPAK